MGGSALVESGHDLVSNPPRPSSTMCVLHQRDEEFEVLMVRRSATARFMAHAWVFPGGVVDPEDHGDVARNVLAGIAEAELGPWLAAAFREVAEETGIWLTSPPLVAASDQGVFAVAAERGLQFDASRVAYFANWITPTMVPQRFDARFFIAAIDTAIDPVPDGEEVDAAEFVTPAEALRRADSNEWLVPFPTQRTLLQLAEFTSVAAAIDEWQQREVTPIQPKMQIAADGTVAVVMPGEPGFDDLEEVEPDAELLTRAAARQGRRIPEVQLD